MIITWGYNGDYKLLPAINFFTTESVSMWSQGSQLNPVDMMIIVLIYVTLND